MTTPTITSVLSDAGSISYTNLLNDIKITIDRNDELFKQIQKSNYPDAGQYTSDLLNYKIDTQITDLTKTRNTVWDFVNKKYQENSKLRSFYFNEIRKIDTHINELEKQQQVNKTLEVAKQKQTELQDVGFEIYCRKVVQERLRMEIFTNRKLDIYV